tara:strand:- start:461 stop:1282 length:822 start_codon:yes stop_codon:yes gene_type:complete
MNAQKAEEKKRKRKGILITISVHAVAVVLFCLFGFDVVDPKAIGFDVEWAIEGIQDAGGEDNLENTSEKDANDNNPPASSSSSKASAQEDEQLITDDASDFAVKNTLTKKNTTPKDVTINETKKNNPNESKEVKKEDEVSDWLKNLPGRGTPKKGADNPGEGKGDGKKTGIEGEEIGKGSASSGKGGEGGDRWDVDGRKPINIERKINDCNETGKVEVYIKINRQGQVISAVDRGGTTQNQCLIKKALEQARGIKYSSSTTFNEGTIIIDLGL